MQRKSVLTSEEVVFLNQLYGSLEEAEKKLKEAYTKNKSEQFKAIKEFILKLQKKIEEFL